MRPAHKKAHPECVFGATTWGACDKATKAVYEDWQAMQQVILAYRIAVDGRRLDEDNLFAALIDYISGKSRDILNKDGNSHRGVFVMKLRAAIERFKAGDIPAYNLYTIPGHVPAPTGGQ